MASPSVQMKVEGGGGGGTGGDPTREILRRNKVLRKSRRERRRGDPSTVASIPSRYQVFFHRSTEAKGFNSGSSRFQPHLHADDNPGPGSYTAPTSSLTTHHPASSSTAGSGGFASKTARFRRGRGGGGGGGVGPGSYNPSLQPLRQDFSSTTVSRLFQTPIAVGPEERDSQVISPSPTSYHPSLLHTHVNNLVSAQAAFNSRSKRSSHSLSSSSSLTPSPGHYNIRDHTLHPSSSAHRSVFASKCRRSTSLPSSGPGPADYSPYPLPSSKHTSLSTSPPPPPPPPPHHHRQKHYLRISAPALPLPPLPPSPGPGHYETQGSIVRSESMKTVKPSGCGFTSNVNRWGSEVKRSQDNEPGPGSYDPVGLSKRSYLYNLHAKWI